MIGNLHITTFVELEVLCTLQYHMFITNINSSYYCGKIWIIWLSSLRISHSFVFFFFPSLSFWPFRSSLSHPTEKREDRRVKMRLLLITYRCWFLSHFFLKQYFTLKILFCKNWNKLNSTHIGIVWARQIQECLFPHCTI